MEKWEENECAEEEPPPIRSTRIPPWQDVNDKDWNDWRWQLRHRFACLRDLQQVLQLTPDEQAAIEASGRMRMAITPYFASLLDPKDPNCPLRRQVVPTMHELDRAACDLVDPLNEDGQSPVPGLVHRYPDRVLMLVTDQCASYCRHCTRRRLVGAHLWHMSQTQMKHAVDYIARTPSVRDVVVSGGDPLLLRDEALERLLHSLRAIPHVEIVRIHTRTPVFLPQRITEQLVTMLRRYHPLYVNIHFNHPKEITPETERACAMLADAGIPLGSQTVLLAGINDCPNIMKTLMHKLLRIRVRPYYIFQCDLSSGIGHFRTPVDTGVAIMEALRGHTSGLAVPTYVIDVPGGGGKVPVGPQYMRSQTERGTLLRNYEERTFVYPEPTGYIKHQPETCESCREAAGKAVAQMMNEQLTRLEVGAKADSRSHGPRSDLEEVLL